MMRKKLLIISAVFVLLGCFGLSRVALAGPSVLAPACSLVDENESEACAANRQGTPDTGNPIYGPHSLLYRAAQLISIIVGMASVVVILIGGYKYVTSSGDPGNIKSAKDTIMFALVGMVVAIVAQSIVVFVLNRL
jgi:hypothetical protein